jgi:cytochrome oxidase Cu insertion factor (SCO1/SenC/PrrC family)
MQRRALMIGVPLLLADAVHAAGDDKPKLQGPHVDASRLPAPGSYTLPVIQACPDGEVLQTDARSARLHTLLRGRVSLLSFMYTYCRDAYGCPLAYKVMTELHAALAQDAALAQRTQLVSLSFDPTNDTPRQMALYGDAYLRDTRVRWRFLTTASVPRLMPLLSGLGQDVTVETDERGKPTRTLNHLLKLFLIDERLQVREIYGVGTIDARVVINDMRTLAMLTPVHG